MIDTKESAQLLAEWAQATLDDLAGAYDYYPGTKTQPLPDVAAELQDISIGPANPQDFPVELQQTVLKQWRYELSFMVGFAESDDPAAQATAQRDADQQLKDFADTLDAAKMADQSLGDRFRMTSIRWSFEFTPGYIEWDDGGVRGREMRMHLVVADVVENQHEFF